MHVKILLIILLLTTAMALSQSAREPKEIVNKESEVENIPKLKDKDVKLFIDKIEIQGRLEKPQAVFIIPGDNPEIDDISIKRSFFDAIFRPVEKEGRIQTKISMEPIKGRSDYIPW